MKSIFKTICISSDHAGFKTKELIKNFLIENYLSIIDLGPQEDKSVDYPDFAKKIAKRIRSKRSEIGILVCGSGTGMAISANKTKGIRAAVGYNIKSTQLSRQHNNANVLVIGGRTTSLNSAKKIIDVFVSTEFEKGRHSKRLKKIS